MYTYDDVKEHSNDKEYVEKAIEEDGLLLDAADPEFQDDKDLVMKAVTKDGGALEFASKRLKADREILMQTITMLCLKR